MREESHLDEMRTAIRGDFERLAERRGEQDLMRVADEEAPEASVEAHEQGVAPEAPEAVPDAQSAPEPEPEPEPERRSWLARLLSPT
jgi:hypothetical protein